MSTKDHELLAGALRAVRLRIKTKPPAVHVGLHLTYRQIVKVLEADNPRFNKTLFYQAVYGEAS